jgi:hypothetical protein
MALQGYWDVPVSPVTHLYSVSLHLGQTSLSACKQANTNELSS